MRFARRLALCVETWSSQENHYAWMWTKKRLLQDLRQPGEDHLYIVHVNRSRSASATRWDLGGPLLGDAQSVLEGLHYTIVEVEGDTVQALLRFAEEKSINIMILGSKGHGRVKRTVGRSTSINIVSKASCACVIVSPRITAGEQTRIQAARQADVLEANVSLQFRRRVAIVLNAGPYDANLVQHAARNVLLAGDRVVLVRCLTRNILNRQNRDELEALEKDSAREIGRNKLRGANVAMAVEILNGGLRVLCNTIESKGIDLVVFMRSDEKRIRRPLPSGIPALQSLPYRCPCPCMVVPMPCLELLSGSSGSFVRSLPSGRAPPLPPPRHSISAHVIRMARRARPGPINMRLGGKQRARSLDSSEFSNDARVLEVIQDEAIELEAIEELDLESDMSQGGSQKGSRDDLDEALSSPFSRQNSLPISSPGSSCPSAVPITELRRRSVGDIVQGLEIQLQEKNEEILQLKEKIMLLQNQSDIGEQVHTG
ncbi:hypothetical protein BSKO_06318 [Bryopsis sp. KO-2023]|nr:hypothetical protein BSKO_06318 [Bryopsis sp. KO-2023]